MPRSVQVLIFSAVLNLSCFAGQEEVVTGTPEPAVSAMKALLAEGEGRALLPVLETQPPEEWAATPSGVKLLAWARKAAEVKEIPATTAALKERYTRYGERDPYQKPYFEKRTLLTQEAMAVWLGGDESRIGRIGDIIRDICAEDTWVLPAHIRDEHHVDLGSAETGVMLAYVLHLLGDRLPEEIQALAYREIEGRILNNYRDYGRKQWYNIGRNNWTGVCAGSVGQTALLLDRDPDRRAAIIALVAEQLNRFLDHGFSEDGACLEGISYWNYGLSHTVSFAEMLRARTQGVVDLLAQDKMKAIARYPLAVYLGSHHFASFADASENGSVMPFLAAKFAERTGTGELLAFTGGLTSWQLSTVLHNLIWYPEPVETAFTPSDIFMPVAGIARLTGSISGAPVVLAIKGGSNAEPHNHNDVGSFVLSIGGEIYLCDPGGGLYSRDYFSPKRYENIFANSYGHSVPRINGQLQRTGPQAKGSIEKDGGKGVRIRFEKAWGLPELTQAERGVSLGEDAVTLEDRFVFSGSGLPIEEVLMTWREVESEGNRVRVKTEKGVLEIQADTGVFRTERLAEACRENHKPGVLTRITLDLPVADRAGVRYTMTWNAGK